MPLAADVEPVVAPNQGSQGEGSQDQGPPLVRRGERIKHPRKFFEQVRVATDKPNIPLSYEDAVNDKVYGQYWKDAIKDELVKLRTLNTWKITDLPDGRRPVGSKWVFAVKYTPTGLIDRFKARLVAQGFL